MGLKVCCRTKLHFEIGIFICSVDDPLGMVNRKVTQIIPFCTVCSQNGAPMRLGVKWDMGRISSVPFETRKDRSKDFELLLRMIYLLWDVATVSPFRREAVLQTVRAMVANVQYVKQASDSSTGNNTVSRYQELFQQFKTLVSRHCERERNIPFYAEQLHITPHHLSAVISRASGRSAMYWVNRAVVLRAKVLLHTSGLLTYEIAERLNFANPPAFNNFFKRETGLTPKAYRENTLV